MAHGLPTRAKSLAIGAGLLLAASGSATAGAPSAFAFFGAPQFDAVTVSPGGGHLGALVGAGDGRRLVVMARDRSRARLIPAAAPLRDYRWVTEERLLLVVGEAWQSPGLAAVNRDGRGYQTLLPPGPDAAAADGARLLALLPQEPASVLVTDDRRRPFAPDVARINVFTGARELVARNPGRMFRWLADGRGRVRAGLGWEPTGNGIRYVLWHRFIPDGDWRRLHDFAPGGPAIIPLAFDPDGRHLLAAASLGRDTTAIRRVDPVEERLGPVLFARPDVDVSDLSLGPAGVTQVHWESGLPQRHLLEDGRSGQQAWLDGRLPGLAHRTVSASRDGRFAVVLAWSDSVPGRYYLFDRERLRLTLVGARRPWLEGRLPARVSVRFEAADGRKLQGYLTRAAGRRDAAPLLLLPHGGPWARDHWGFDAPAQYFAAHGWTVLQVNFRGSTGFGRAHLNAGRGEWGGAMLRDLADGARWAVSTQGVDPARVCILGASFGGYAALMSGVRFPEVYRCAVAFAPVTDLAARIEHFLAAGNERAYHEWRDMVGDPAAAMTLVRQSPLNHARGIELPVLLAHGARDRRVPIEHSRRLASAMAGAGRMPRTLWLARTSHDIARTDGAVRFYWRALRFMNDAADL